MGTHDELCMLSGGQEVSGGPKNLIRSDEIRKTVDILVSEVRRQRKKPSMSTLELSSIITGSLNVLVPKKGVYDRDIPKPEGLGDWVGYNSAVAIGAFDEYGAEAMRWDDGDIYPFRGREVICRKVSDYEGSSYFQHLWDPSANNGDGDWVAAMSGVDSSRRSANFYCLYGPYEYFKAWIDPKSMPSRSFAFPNDSAPLEWYQELYEVIHSCGLSREPFSGLLTVIDYGGLEKTNEQWQDHFRNARKGVKHLSRAIANGLRGAELYPAIWQDYGVWMAVRPDIWAHCAEPRKQKRVFKKVSKTLFNALPTEILVIILEELDFHKLLNFASVSRSIYQLMHHESVIQTILQSHVQKRDGLLRWFGPVTTVDGEDPRFADAMQTWSYSPFEEVDKDSYDQGDIDWYGFIRESYPSFSMQNRRRLWNISRQFENLWREYRTNGFKRDVFTLGFKEEF